MKNIETYKRWLKFLNKTKSLLSSLQYKEVITPTLVSSPAMEAYLHGFKIEDESLYLPTSPEFSLKKLWLSGDEEFLKIYEVSKAFRAKEEQGPFHLNEFTMLEFYDNSLNINEFIRLSIKLVSSLLSLNVSNLVEVVSIPELFKALTGEKLKPDYQINDYKRICTALGVQYDESDSLNDLFQRLYLEVIEPSLSPRDLIVLKDYPPFLSALAKVNSVGWADRFEVFFMGLELANGYNETFDSNLIKERWIAENKIREDLGFKPHPYDEDLLKATKNSSFDSGCGVAMGLERIYYLSEKLKGSEIELKHTKY